MSRINYLLFIEFKTEKINAEGRRLCRNWNFELNGDVSYKNNCFYKAVLF